MATTFSVSRLAGILKRDSPDGRSVRREAGVSQPPFGPASTSDRVRGRRSGYTSVRTASVKVSVRNGKGAEPHVYARGRGRHQVQECPAGRIPNTECLIDLLVADDLPEHPRPPQNPAGGHGARLPFAGKRQ